MSELKVSFINNSTILANTDAKRTCCDVLSACLPPLGQTGDELVCVGSLGSLLHFLLTGPRPSKHNILADSGGEQHRLLTHQPYLPAQPCQWHIPHILSIQHHLHAAQQVMSDGQLCTMRRSICQLVLEGCCLLRAQLRAQLCTMQRRISQLVLEGCCLLCACSMVATAHMYDQHYHDR